MLDLERCRCFSVNREHRHVMMHRVKLVEPQSSRRLIVIGNLHFVHANLVVRSGRRDHNHAPWRGRNQSDRNQRPPNRA